MTRLSLPLSELKQHYTVVVIGSGYGGAIAASRLARSLSHTGAGRQVCVLERGLELQPGEYPATSREGLRAMQFDAPQRHLGSRTGLYDFRLNPDINVVLGCGLGGTSLINGNVALPPDPRVFDDLCWPPELRGNMEALSPFIERAEAMLKPTPYPSQSPPLLKLNALRKAAQELEAMPLTKDQAQTNENHDANEASAAQKDSAFYRPPLTVNFESGLNPVGVHQEACVGCGDCCSGCNYGAKNTVLMNYLPDAHQHGAQIFTGISVTFIEQMPTQHQSQIHAPELHSLQIEDHNEMQTAEDGRCSWLVHGELLKTGNASQDARAGTSVTIRADILILAAGTLGSTEILLRSAQKGLPLSPQVGQSFTGNGDFLGFGYNNPDPINGIGLGANHVDPHHPVGATISGIIDLRDTEKLEDGFVIQDGAIPGPLAPFLPLAFVAASKLLKEGAGASKQRKNKRAAKEDKSTLQDSSGQAPYVKADRRSALRREWESLRYGSYRGAVHHTQTYLVMAHDDSGGKMYLDPKTNRLRIAWPQVGHQPVFEKIAAQLERSTEAAGGTFVGNPAWSKRLGRHLTTVHPLGGCRMAEDATCGVVNHKGQVFAGAEGDSVHRGLYVCDGAIIPRSLGINPLLTISALAERCCALLAEDYGWTLDYSLPISVV